MQSVVSLQRNQKQKIKKKQTLFTFYS